MVHPPPGTCEGGEEQRQYLFIYLFIYFQLSCEGDHLRKEPSFIKFVSSVSVRYPRVLVMNTGAREDDNNCNLKYFLFKIY
jgi:hypothetical protein